MSWVEHHAESERLASAASIAARKGEPLQAVELYRQAAEAEMRALAALDPTKLRTVGITGVSAAFLWYKARESKQAENLAHLMLGKEGFPDFAVDQMRDLLHTMWGEQSLQQAGVRFVGDEILVSVKGGRIVVGGAPLDLVLLKVEQVSKLFLRTVEWILGEPYRKHGNPNPEIEAACQPWVFQAQPGSYQFAIRMQEPVQQDIFRTAVVESKQVASTVLAIMRASVDDPEHSLPQIVPDPDYRATFLRMTRNLAPTPQHASFDRVEFRQASQTEEDPIVLRPETQQGINKLLRRQAATPPDTNVLYAEAQVRGVLRGLSLERDWIEVVTQEGVQSKKVKIEGAGDVVDDVIGPMVNKLVIVDTWRTGDDRHKFRDIQPAQ